MATTTKIATEKALQPAASRIVDVAQKQEIAVIVRAGKEVTPPIVDKSKIDDFVGGLIPITRVDTVRVVQQSIPAGVRVAKGTAIDLVLVAPTAITLGLIDGVHDDLKAKTVVDVAPVLKDPAVAAVLDGYSDPADVSVADQASLTAALAKYSIGIDNSKSTKSFAAAFTTLKGAEAFQ